MRHAKQLIYGVLYLIFWVAVGSGVYFHYVKPAPSCFDGIKNQAEEGIDCGGVCGNECIPSLEPITASNVWLLPIVISSSVVDSSSAFTATTTAPTTRASLLAEVRNPNLDYAAVGFTYTFKLYDEAGAEIISIPGSSYMYGAEVKYVAVPNINLPVDVRKVFRTELEISKPLWKKTVLFEKPDAIVSLTRVDSNGTFAVQGNIRNNEAVPLHVDLVAIFKDAAGTPKGASLTVLERLPGGEIRPFAIFHPLIENILLDRTQVFASTYTIQ
jgi:hypothetical protein